VQRRFLLRNPFPVHRGHVRYINRNFPVKLTAAFTVDEYSFRLRTHVVNYYTPYHQRHTITRKQVTEL